ncbi:MAG: hypothetical protein NC820_08000, partial [Candidatus Omnitrophica bacterium]|nr:hypothetical protein [Candidatus Omnitrophota bacterium]
ISSAMLLGNPIYVVVDYEYEPKDFIEEGTFGVRFAQQINDHIKLGTTYIKDEKESGYELRGYDLTVKLKRSTEFKLEYAESKSSVFDSYVSYDGGLSFETLSSEESLKGEALKVSLKTDLGELFNKKENKLLLEAYFQDISRGFSSQSGISQQGTQKYGMKLTANITNKDTVSFSYDYQELEARENIEASNTLEGASKVSNYTLQYKHTETKYTFTGEYRYHDVKGETSDEDVTAHTLAGKIEYNLTEKAKVYLQEQTNIKGPKDTRTIVGTILELSKKIKVKLEQMIGNRGNATSISVDSQVDSKTRMYTTYSFGREKGEGKTSTTTLGTETLVDKNTKVISAQEYKVTDNSRSSSRIVGLDYNKDKWDFDARLEKGEVFNQGVTTDRTAVSLGVGYTDPDKLKVSTQFESRFDRGEEDKDQYLFKNSIEYKLNPDWTLFSRFDYSHTHNKSTGKTEAEFKEFTFGSAFRPVDFDRLNILGKISYIEDKQPSSQTDNTNISRQRAFVFAVEGAYDLTKHLQLVEKFALKRGEESVGGREMSKAEKFLWINRFNYHITSKWDIGVEYRTLAVKQAQDNRTGFLFEISRHLNNNLQVGFGYNFTDFSDDLTETNDYSVKGFFFRITGKY